jgi:hypothetical protein
MPEIAVKRLSVARSTPIVNLADLEPINLPKVSDPRGNLTFLESQRHVSFDIKRVYYTYDVPGGEARGGHAHKQCETFIIAASGSFDVVLDDGFSRRKFFLNRSYKGLFVPRMMWREIHDFSSGSVCLVLASHLYEESDYFRSYEEFRRAVELEDNGRPRSVREGS